MKKHAIIPVFIPHLGCPHNCVFCNQHAITARTAEVTPEDVVNIIEEYLPPLEGRGLEEIELAFFGGSFTGIPLDDQTAFLKIAKRYKDSGRIDKIHLSTRPDYIDEIILDNLKKYSVDVIELGVQSFDEEVLRLSERGHDIKSVYKACRMIREYGFVLGIQLMIGLPGDTRQISIESARRAAEIHPEIARLYPTVILKDTELYNMYVRGTYRPENHEEMVETVKEMYKILTAAGVNVIRVGLKSTELINDSGESAVAGNSYHPAFRQLVEGAIAREYIESKINELFPKAVHEGYFADSICPIIEIYANDRTFSNIIGHKGVNKKEFADKYPWLNIEYKRDNVLADGEIRVAEAKYLERLTAAAKEK